MTYQLCRECRLVGSDGPASDYRFCVACQQFICADCLVECRVIVKNDITRHMCSKCQTDEFTKVQLRIMLNWLCAHPEYLQGGTPSSASLRAHLRQLLLLPPYVSPLNTEPGDPATYHEPPDDAEVNETSEEEEADVENKAETKDTDWIENDIPEDASSISDVSTTTSPSEEEAEAEDGVPRKQRKRVAEEILKDAPAKRRRVA